MNNPLAQFLTLLGAVWRRRGVVLLISWFVCLAGWWLVIQQPDVYRSSARVFVDTEHILRPLLRGLAVENDVRNEVQLVQRTLMTRPNLERVARMTDLDITVDTPGGMEKLVQDIQDRTTVSTAGREGDNLFTIAYKDGSPQKARDVTQAFLTIFVESNLGQNRKDMETARRFIEEQIANYETQLQEAEARLARFKQENVGLLSGETGFTQKLGASQGALRAVESELRNAKLRYDTLERELSSTPQFFPIRNNEQAARRGGLGPSDIEVRVIQSEAQLDALLAEYTEKHPDVVIARRRLEALYAEREELQRAALQWVDENARRQQESAAGGEEEFGISNPIYESLKIQLVQEEARIAALRQQLIEAQSEVRELQRIRSRVPEVEAELTRLNRDYDVIRTRHAEFLSRRESERVARARAVEGENIQFRIIEPPQVPVAPIGPNRPMFLIGVLIVGLGAGIALALLLAMSSDRVSGAFQLKETFAMPVLGTISTLRSSGGRAWVVAKGMTFATALIGLLAIYGVLSYVENDVGLNQSALVELVQRHAPIEWLNAISSA